MTRDSFTIWEGTFPDLQSVPTDGDGYEGDTWSKRSRQRMAALLADAATKKPTHPCYTESLLPVVASLARPAASADALRILDYGGGPGFGYIPVLNALRGRPDVRFVVKEVAAVCRLGQEFFGSDERIRFVEDLPDESFDVVHLGSSIQYEPDWKGLLRALAHRCTGWLAITDLPAGPNPTYASGQRYYDSVLPCWFFNEDQFCNEAEQAGFQLRFRSTYGGTILGAVGLPQENFPAELRVGRSINMVFERTNQTIPGRETYRTNP